ncbi:MAG: hypothetical protein A2516_08565 [Alphaproteobacteria bacterium RIFOXYD12_FULL_60_8]|nr:MAG: hypothetical protein A2516_08565 [Alphaproteobacteria bacterium RIFOXYD12_FULL_60_8]
MLTWFAVNTLARAEDKAKFNLERQGFSVYLPRYLKKRRHARRTEIVPTPLFPRYLFVGLDKDTARWRSINSTFGVCRLLTNGNEPIPVPPSIMDMILARENEEGWVEMTPSLPYREGEKVQVLDGPMKDHVGLFSGVDDNERVFVLLDLMGRAVKIRMDAEHIGPAH